MKNTSLNVAVVVPLLVAVFLLGTRYGGDKKEWICHAKKLSCGGPSFLWTPISLDSHPSSDATENEGLAPVYLQNTACTIANASCFGRRNGPTYFEIKRDIVCERFDFEDVKKAPPRNILFESRTLNSFNSPLDRVHIRRYR